MLFLVSAHAFLDRRCLVFELFDNFKLQTYGVLWLLPRWWI